MATFTASQIINTINNRRQLRQAIRQARVRNSNLAVAALLDVNASLEGLRTSSHLEKSPRDVIGIFNYRFAITRLGRSMAEGARQIAAACKAATARSSL
jgi:hypothetical protein